MIELKLQAAKVLLSQCIQMTPTFLMPDGKHLLNGFTTERKYHIDLIPAVRDKALHKHVDCS